MGIPTTVVFRPQWITKNLNNWSKKSLMNTHKNSLWAIKLIQIFFMSNQMNPYERSNWYKYSLWVIRWILMSDHAMKNISYEWSQYLLWVLIGVSFFQFLSRSKFPPIYLITQYSIKWRKKSYVSAHNTWPLTTYNLHLFIPTIWGNNVPVCIGLCPMWSLHICLFHLPNKYLLLLHKCLVLLTQHGPFK